MKYTCFGAFFFLFFASSCSRLLVRSNIKNTPTQNFETMWNTVNEHYTYFEKKGIDWDSIKIAYGKRVTNTMSEDSLFTVLASMLSELRDGHVNLYAPYDRSRNWSWFQDYADNYNPNFVDRVYLKKDFQLLRSFPNQIIDSVGYVQYHSFSNPVGNDVLDYLLNKRFKQTKGIIIDVRNNGGGSLTNVFKIMNHFTEKKTLVGYSLFKNGKNKNDYTDTARFYASPLKGTKKKKFEPYTRPVVILTNRHCYSATTHFAAYMSLLPNVTIIGDRTGGGGGIPISADLPNGWQYRFSASRETLPDGTEIEFGTDPDIVIGTGAKEELDGKDALIEKALEIICKK